MRHKNVRIREDHINWIRQTDATNSIQFSFCALIKNKGAHRRELTQICQWASCRESLTNFIADGFRNNVYSNNCSLIDKEAMRLLVMFKKEGAGRLVKENLERGVRIVNFFERKMGWRLSEISKARDKNIPSHCYIYVLLGPKQWMTSPHMVSLYTLLIRVGRFNDFGRFRTYKKFVDICNGLRDEAIKVLVPGGGCRATRFYNWPDAGFRDIDHLNYVADKIMTVLENRDKIFEGRDCRSLYLRASSYDGITNLCLKDVDDTRLRKRFGKVYKDAGFKPSCSIHTAAEKIRAENRQIKESKVRKESATVRKPMTRKDNENTQPEPSYRQHSIRTTT